MLCWAEARVKIARMTLTIKLDGNWSSVQLANSAPPLSVTDSAIAPSARMLFGVRNGKILLHVFSDSQTMLLRGHPLTGYKHVGAVKLPKNCESHIDASHSRQPLVKGERLVRYEVNAVMTDVLKTPWLYTCISAPVCFNCLQHQPYMPH